jgi:hypothetical protein
MPGIMTPNLPVWGLMLAGPWVSALVLDMLITTLLSCGIPIESSKYRSSSTVAQIG